MLSASTKAGLLLLALMLEQQPFVIAEARMLSGLHLAPSDCMGLPRQISHVSAPTTESDTSAESRTLDSLSENVHAIDGVWSNDVEPGDWLVVHTQNSVYRLTALGGGLFQVDGGWFAAHDGESDKVHVVGCTWGGHAILTGLIAAPGMCIEFDNTVQTTSVRDVRLYRYDATSVCH